MASTRSCKRHLTDDTESATPKTTKYRRLQTKQNQKQKSLKSYKEFIHACGDVPRTTAYRRRVLNMNHLADKHSGAVNHLEEREEEEKEQEDNEKEERGQQGILEEERGPNKRVIRRTQEVRKMEEEGQSRGQEEGRQEKKARKERSQEKREGEERSHWLSKGEEISQEESEGEERSQEEKEGEEKSREEREEEEKSREEREEEERSREEREEEEKSREEREEEEKSREEREEEEKSREEREEEERSQDEREDEERSQDEREDEERSQDEREEEERSQDEREDEERSQDEREDEERSQDEREEEERSQDEREEEERSQEQKERSEGTMHGNQHFNNSFRIHHGDDPVYPGASLTKGQSLLLLMSYVLRHNLGGVALQHLLNIFNEHFPGLVPATLYLFDKAYGQFGHYVPHFYCIKCESYIGPSETAPTNCSSCKYEFDVDYNLRAGSYFLVLSLASQIVDILEKPNINLNQRQSITGIICDIQCGAEYKNLKQSGKMGDDDISIIWNCDGVPVFESNNYQIWPIQCQTIELLPKDRCANICIPCLWFGDSKPNMITFLTAFVAELKELEQTGIKWKDSENREHTSKVYSLICSADSVARPLLKNTKQFNGKYGCDFCLHSGGGPYVWETPEPPLRTEQDHFEQAMLATPAEPVMGVKGPSPLMELENFNIVTGFVPEYQHSVCLGTTRQLASLWLDSKHHEKDWYLGTKNSIIDKQLLAVKPPVEVTRAPRSINDRKFWKASEWRSFLLFYALPVLNGILKKKYWNHLFLLVFAMHILLQDAIKVCHVNMAEQALRKFVFNFEKLYGASNVSFNVHLLMHMAESVRNWGPLWATSTFSFESFNGTLLKFFNGTTHVPTQIVRRFLRSRSLSKKAEKIMVSANVNVRHLFDNLQGISRHTKRSAELPGHVRGFGCPKKESTSVLQRMAIDKFIGVTVHSGLFYTRFIYNSVVYHSYNSTALTKRNNSVIQLRDGTFCKIMSLVAFKTEDGASTSCVLVKELAGSRKLCRDIELNISSTFMIEVADTNNVLAVHPHSFKRKCVMVVSKDKMHVIPLPSNVERD